MGMGATSLGLSLLLQTAAAASQQNRPSTNWWSRLIEKQSSHSMPANRRSHSATVYGDTNAGEWMIVSGGFTDQDWQSFPVWAFDMKESRSFDDEFSSENDLETDNYGPKQNVTSRRSPWIDLTGLDIGATESPEDPMKDSNSILYNDGKNETPIGPKGRVGHLSSIYKNCLYIFGGLTYSLGSFHVENDNGEDDNGDETNTMIVWRACGLSELFSAENRQRILDQNSETIGLLNWERIVPKVNTTLPTRPDINTKADDSNRRAATDAPKDDLTALVQELEPIMLSRGESQGGHFIPTNGASFGESFIIYGGMHRHRTSVLENGANSPSSNNEVPLGDVWKYDYDTETISLLAPYPPLEWQRDYTTTSTFPTARTSHAGTVVGDKLIVHGGMGSYGGQQRSSETDNVDQRTSSYSSSSYATYKTYTSPKWVPLADTWVFDLTTLKWRERVQYPQLARSYHSLVGWPDGSIAAFGGFQQDNNIGGETVAFVFKDVIVNRDNETHWLKLQSPYSQIANWQKYHYKPRVGISNRLEHTAVLDQFGSMYVWGGRFQTVHQISGMWRLDLFNPDQKLEYELAQPDGIEQYEAELEALHMFIALMMFISLAMSSFFSMLQQRRMREAAEGGNVGPILPRRGGLTRRVIDSLPLKHFEAVDSVGSNANNSTHEERDCCAICLVEYEQGCEIRSLPCSHDFCRECIDSWLEEHTSCPACRQRVENIPLDQPLWAVRLGTLYNPNRRNPRFDPLANNSSQAGSQTSVADETPAADEWHDQPATLRSSLNPMLRYLRPSGHTAVPNEESVETIQLELV